MKHYPDTRTQPEEEKPLFPMRVNKYLALKGRGSRRDVDELVKEGRVLINGVLAVLGSKVVEADRVEVRFHGTKEKQKGQGHAMVRHNRKERKKR